MVRMAAEPREMALPLPLAAGEQAILAELLHKVAAARPKPAGRD
jgi:hypothetical protein